MLSSISSGASPVGISARIFSPAAWSLAISGGRSANICACASRAARRRGGEAAKRYNVLQQFAYLMVVFVLFPLMILTGLTMSLGIDSALPRLLTLFGGRQTAPLIHFAAASSLALFVIVHVVMVLVSGVWNNLRSMVTGWYDLGNPRTTDVR